MNTNQEAPATAVGRPARVEVGQRWSNINASVATIETLAPDGSFTLRWSDGSGGMRRTDSLLTSPSWKFYGYAPGYGPASTDTPRPAPEFEPGAKWRGRLTGKEYIVEKCDGKIVRFTNGCGVDVGDVRRCHEPIAAPSPAPEMGRAEPPPCRPGIDRYHGPCTRGTPYDLCARVSDGETPSTTVRCACECHADNRPQQPKQAPGPAKEASGGSAPPSPPAALKREVSVDGRSWVDYDRLTDGDAFEAYEHWRVVVGDQVEREHHPKPTRINLGASPWGDAEIAIRQRDCDDRLRAQEAKPTIQTPWMAHDVKPTQKRAYQTPSGTPQGRAR